MHDSRCRTYEAIRCALTQFAQQLFRVEAQSLLDALPASIGVSIGLLAQHRFEHDVLKYKLDRFGSQP
jgi:hypothetical protein|tara:strand:- start:340 stop:543 length:204 start_codon:yes stop_codon:yes gene_type:complete